MLELIIIAVGATVIGFTSVFIYSKHRETKRSLKTIEADAEASEIAKWKYKVTLDPYCEPEMKIEEVIIEVEPKLPEPKAIVKVAKPQCLAMTDAQHQCRNSARGLSTYCASHKGYHPLTAEGLAKRIEGSLWKSNDKLSDKKSLKTADTKPKSKRGKNTKLKVRKNQKPNKRQT